MSHAQRSRFEYGGLTFETTLPARPWTPIDDTVGGSRVAAAGIPAAYIVRRDALLDLPLRVLETEWPALANLVAFGQSAQPFLWFPETLLTESFTVYLENPKPGERWSPTRSSEYPRMLEMTLTLRGVGAAVPWREYFG